MEVVATSLLPRGYRYDISYGDICHDVNIFALVLIEDRWEKYILNNLLVVGVMWGFSTFDELLRKKTKIKFVYEIDRDRR